MGHPVALPEVDEPWVRAGMWHSGAEEPPFPRGAWLTLPQDASGIEPVGGSGEARSRRGVAGRVAQEKFYIIATRCPKGWEWLPLCTRPLETASGN